MSDNKRESKTIEYNILSEVIRINCYTTKYFIIFIVYFIVAIIDANTTNLLFNIANRIYLRCCYMISYTRHKDILIMILLELKMKRRYLYYPHKNSI